MYGSERLEWIRPLNDIYESHCRAGRRVSPTPKLIYGPWKWKGVLSHYLQVHCIALSPSSVSPTNALYILYSRTRRRLEATEATPPYQCSSARTAMLLWFGLFHIHSQDLILFSTLQTVLCCTTAPTYLRKYTRFKFNYSRVHKASPPHDHKCGAICVDGQTI